ncbi:hypothetical protein BDW62DRAFT_212516 [Aspergillus aurantiobrunneus]
MRLQPTWLLAALGALFIPSATGNDIIDVSLVFPQNKTYTPADRFPVVFAFQNPERARYLGFSITYYLWPIDDHNKDHRFTRSHDLRAANWSSHDPYFAQQYFSILNIPGRWRLSWSVYWDSCDEGRFENHETADMVYNTSSLAIWFNMQGPGAAESESEPLDVDLVSATSETSCPDLGLDTGVGINITEKTMSVPWFVDWSNTEFSNSTCAFVDPTPTVPDPCKVDIDRTVAQRMEASYAVARCKVLLPPNECPEDEDDENSALKQGAEGVLGDSGLLALFGALGLLALV